MKKIISAIYKVVQRKLYWAKEAKRLEKEFAEIPSVPQLKSLYD